MGFENFNLDEVAENAHKRSTGDQSAADLIYIPEEGRWKVMRKNDPRPRTALVSNQMTDEGFA